MARKVGGGEGGRWVAEGSARIRLETCGDCACIAEPGEVVDTQKDSSVVGGRS